MLKNIISSVIFTCSLFLLSGCRAKQTNFYRSNHYKSNHPEIIEPVVPQTPVAPPANNAVRHKVKNAPQQVAFKAPSKSIKDMNYKEAAEAKAYHEHMKNDDMIIKCAQRMLAVGNTKDIGPLTLELAELFLEKHNYDDAERYALRYQQEYPGSQQAAYAGYIAVRSNFLSKLSADRSPKKTKTTIELAHKFLDTYTKELEYRQSVKDMMDLCYKDLVTSEMHVIESYLNKYKYSKNDKVLTGAHNRIAYIKEKLLPNMQDGKAEESRVLQLELTMAQATGKQDIVKAKELELHSKFPQGARLAHADKKWWHIF